MMDTFNGALTLNQTLLHNLRESPQVVQRGLLVVLMVGLLVGGVNGVRTLMSGLNPEMDFAQLRDQFEQALDQQALAATTPEQRELIKAFRDNLEPGIALLREVNELPTPLPRPVGALFRGLGVFVSQPLNYLGSLMLWVVFTHIAARWLGGQGSIQQMLGLGALSVAPHALDALAFIPVLGSIVSVIAAVWGLIVLVVGTSVAHRLDTGRAALAVFLFPLIGAVLALLGCCVLFGLALSGAAS